MRQIQVSSGAAVVQRVHCGEGGFDDDDDDGGRWERRQTGQVRVGWKGWGWSFHRWRQRQSKRCVQGVVIRPARDQLDAGDSQERIRLPVTTESIRSRQTGHVGNSYTLVTRLSNPGNAVPGSKRDMSCSSK